MYLLPYLLRLTALGPRGSGPEENITDALVQSLPPGIREPAEKICCLADQGSLPRNLANREGSQAWGMAQIEVLNNILRHAEQAVGHALLNPQNVSTYRPPATETSLQDPEYSGAPSKFFAILFDLPIDPKTEQTPENPGIPASSLEWWLPESPAVLIPLRLAEERFLSLRKSVSHVLSSPPRNGEPSQVHALRNNWRHLLMKLTAAVDPLVGLCTRDWEKALETVGSMPPDAFHSLQDQVNAHVQEAANAFAALYQLFADDSSGEQELQGTRKYYTALTIDHVLSILPGTDDIVDVTSDLQILFCESASPGSLQQINSFELLITQSLVRLAAHTVRLAALMPERSPTQFTPIQTAPNTCFGWAHMALQSVKWIQEGLYKASTDLSSDESVVFLQKAFYVLIVDFYPFLSNVQNILLVNDSRATFGNQCVKLAGDFYKIVSNVLSFMDGMLSQANHELQKLERVQLAASILLPARHGRDSSEFVDTSGTLFIWHALELLNDLKQLIDVPRGYEYDADRLSFLKGHL